jgi:hypothetical protein
MRDRHFCQNMLTDPELPVPRIARIACPELPVAPAFTAGSRS